ncbi:MAG: hypothetical protein KBC74_00760 [Candidatus Pacebacteria bacterium]|nr:hypothetical protein [Candidatus Paceibacterota bacterium]MBP9832044.1 hypothetical protein [Candidatus Paceibacterota bacterium]
MGEGKKEEVLSPTTLNPFDPSLEPEVADKIATLFIALVRRQGSSYHPQGGKHRKKSV